MISHLYLKNFVGFGVSWTEVRGILEMDLKKAALKAENKMTFGAAQEHVGHTKRVGGVGAQEQVDKVREERAAGVARRKPRRSLHHVRVQFVQTARDENVNLLRETL